MPTSPLTNNSPAHIRFAVLAICALTALTTLPWIFMAVGKFGGFAWGLFGFELIVLLGCLMTMLVCVGKVRVGMSMPMAIACLVGTILVAVVFGLYVDARAVVGDNPGVFPWIKNTILLRLAAMAGLGLLATLDVYRRDPRSWGLMIRSVIFFVPVFAVLGWLKVAGIPTIENSSGELSPLKMVIFLLSGLIFGILFSIGGHFLIRSYEIALPEAQQDLGAKKTA